MFVKKHNFGMKPEQTTFFYFSRILRDHISDLAGDCFSYSRYPKTTKNKVPDFFNQNFTWIFVQNLIFSSIWLCFSNKRTAKNLQGLRSYRFRGILTDSIKFQKIEKIAKDSKDYKLFQMIPKNFKRFHKN